MPLVISRGAGAARKMPSGRVLWGHAFSNLLAVLLRTCFFVGLSGDGLQTIKINVYQRHPGAFLP